jgi:GNAT superfamily N-acetyltransferase
MSSLTITATEAHDPEHRTTDLLLSVRLSDRPLASAQLRWWQGASSHAVLRSFRVEPEMRGRGVGLRLIAALLEACRARGVDSVAGSVHQALVATCRAVGFVPLGKGRTLDGRVYLPMVLDLDHLESAMRDHLRARDVALAIARLGAAHDIAAVEPAADWRDRVASGPIAV